MNRSLTGRVENTQARDCDTHGTNYQSHSAPRSRTQHPAMHTTHTPIPMSTTRPSTATGVNDLSPNCCRQGCGRNSITRT
jgi:hypothetical protein